MNSGWMSAQNSCSHSASCEPPGAIGAGSSVDDRQRCERFPRERRAQLRIEREQFEQDRRARARRTDDEQRRVDRLGVRSAGRARPRVLESQPGLEDAQHLAAREHAPEQVQLRLRCRSRRAAGGTSRPSPATRRSPVSVSPVPTRATASSSSGRGSTIELRIADDVAEQVEPAHPVRVHELLHHASPIARCARPCRR